MKVLKALHKKFEKTRKNVMLALHVIALCGSVTITLDNTLEIVRNLSHAAIILEPNWSKTMFTCAEKLCWVKELI